MSTIKQECIGCKYFWPAHMGGYGPEGEYFPAECVKGASVNTGECNGREDKHE
jgi:hypothetical protein